MTCVKYTMDNYKPFRRCGTFTIEVDIDKLLLDIFEKGHIYEDNK